MNCSATRNGQKSQPNTYGEMCEQSQTAVRPSPLPFPFRTHSRRPMPQPTGKRPMLQVCKPFHSQPIHTLSNQLTTLTNLRNTDSRHTLQVPKAHLPHLQRTKSLHKGSLLLTCLCNNSLNSFVKCKTNRTFAAQYQKIDNLIPR